MTIAAPFAITVSPAASGELEGTRAWLWDALAGTGLEERLPGEGDAGGCAIASDSLALVARTAFEVVGVVLYALVAGTVSCGTILLVGVAPPHRGAGTGAALVSAAAVDLAERGARTIVLEMPDEERLSRGRSLLRMQGFIEEGTVPDYYRDGVALVILRRASA